MKENFIANIPRLTSHLVSHKQLLDTFINLFNTNKLHHAYILQGKKGIGKATFAYYFSKLILSNNENKITSTNLYKDNNDINLINNNIHSNLLVIEPDIDENNNYKNSINIDKVRSIKEFINLSSYNNKLKIIIIDSINNFNLNSNNAILKILEEPNSNCLFLIINHAYTNLLKTIESRCIKLLFNDLSKEDLIKILENLGINNQIKEEYLNISEGSIEHILWFLNKNNENLYTLSKNIIENEQNISKISELIEKSKNITTDDFKFLINILLYKLTKNNAKSDSCVYNLRYKFNKILDQSNVYNLDEGNILSNLILDIITQRRVINHYEK